MYGGPRLLRPRTRPTTRTRRPATSARPPTPATPNRSSSVSSTTTEPGSVSDARIVGVRSLTTPMAPDSSREPITQQTSEPPRGLRQ
jgi:hypothetical protein